MTPAEVEEAKREGARLAELEHRLGLERRRREAIEAWRKAEAMLGEEKR